MPAELSTLQLILLRSATYQPAECCVWVTTDSADMMSMLLQGACPSLETINLSSCPGLEYVLVQSSSLTQVNLSNCGLLSKVTSVIAGCCYCQWQFPLPCMHVDVANMRPVQCVHAECSDARHGMLDIEVTAWHEQAHCPHAGHVPAVVQHLGGPTLATQQEAKTASHALPPFTSRPAMSCMCSLPKHITSKHCTLVALAAPGDTSVPAAADAEHHRLQQAGGAAAVE
jgi:hypothetical protein